MLLICFDSLGQSADNKLPDSNYRMDWKVTIEEQYNFFSINNIGIYASLTLEDKPGTHMFSFGPEYVWFNHGLEHHFDHLNQYNYLGFHLGYKYLFKLNGKNINPYFELRTSAINLNYSFYQGHMESNINTKTIIVKTNIGLGIMYSGNSNYQIYTSTGVGKLIGYYSQKSLPIPYLVIGISI